MYVPSLDEILKNYKRISEEKYRVLYKLLFFSGIRVVEGIRMLSSYDPKNLEIKGNNPLAESRLSKGLKLFLCIKSHRYEHTQ